MLPESSGLLLKTLTTARGLMAPFPIVWSSMMIMGTIVVPNHHYRGFLRIRPIEHVHLAILWGSLKKLSQRYIHLDVLYSGLKWVPKLMISALARFILTTANLLRLGTTPSLLLQLRIPRQTITTLQTLRGLLFCNTCRNMHSRCTRE